MTVDSTYIVGGQVYSQGRPVDGDTGTPRFPDSRRPTGSAFVPQQQAAGDGMSEFERQQLARMDAARTSQQNTLIAQLRDFMASNGMSELMAAMEKYVRAGYTGDAVWVMARNDPQFKDAYAKRFAANSERAKLGLPELLPATYIEMEQGYRTAMLNRGMPPGLFDTPEDFTRLIARDVSVKEVADRLDTALAYINFDGNAAVKEELRTRFGMTDAEMAAYMLDPERTQSYLETEFARNLRRANIAGAARNAGVSTSLVDQASDMISSSATQGFQQATEAFKNIAQQQEDYRRLAAMSGLSGTADELVTEAFGLAGADQVTNKKKVLASQERARFGGSSGLGSSSLSAGRGAQ